MSTLLFSFLLLIFPAADDIAAYSPSPPSADTVSADSLLRLGIEAEREGRFEEALSYWLEIRSLRTTPDLSLATRYIRLATEQEMESHYRAAWALYAWGLTAEDVPANREALELELRMIEPLVEDTLRERWTGMLEEERPELFGELRAWWNTQDPTPATTYNERVVEHHRRIAHARDEYSFGSDSTGSADDRGAAYLRYGTPDRTYSGRLWLRGPEVCQVLKARMIYFTATVDCNSRSVRQMRDYIQELMQNPRYEIWVYDTEDRYEEMDYNLVLLFGEEGDSGQFRQLQTIDDLIPSQAFYHTGRYSYQGITPGIVIQWLYYRQLTSVDPYFSDAFSQLELRFMRNQSPENRYLGLQMRHENADRRERYEEHIPDHFSTYVHHLPDIPVEVHQYRMLDDENRPVFATFMNSRPQQAFLDDFLSNRDSMVSDSGMPVDSEENQREILQSYRLYHGVELRNAKGERLTGERYQPVLMIDGNNVDLPSSSVFTVPSAPGETEQLFYAELQNRHPESRPEWRSPLPDQIRGLGRLTVPQPDPLENDPSELQMSDLILGYGKTDSASTESFLPFVVSNDREIPEGEALALHFEIYHLQRNDDGVTDFTVDYEILPLNFLGWAREGKDDLSLTLFFEQNRTRFEEDLEIEASGLEPGRYVLRLEARDRVSGKRAYREVKFRVIESGE